MRVISANVYRGNKHLADDLDLIARKTPVYAGLQEATRVNKSPRFYRRNAIELDRFSDEVVALVDDKTHNRGSATFQVSEDTGRPVGHERWTNVDFTITEGLYVAFINTHLNAAIMKSNGRVKNGWIVTEEYVKHMKALMATIKWVRSMGYYPVLTADANYRLKGGITKRTAWRWSPHKVFSRCGMTWVANGIDGVAFDKNMWYAATTQVLKSRGSDHNFFMVDLQRK